jgi:hypothetical protein
MASPEQLHDIAKAKMEARQRRNARIANALRATWRFPAIAAVVLAVLSAAAFLILRVVLPSTTTTFISRIQFTFESEERRRYPNGVLFTINEILDLPILAAVYNRLELEHFSIEREEFYAGFSIRPFALTELEIVEQVRQQLSDRRILSVERERLEQQLRTRLEQASRRAAELSFTVRPPLVLPPEVGRAIVQLVPRVWSQDAIEKKGILRLKTFSGVMNVISRELIGQQALPLSILALTEASLRLDERLAEMSNTPGIWTVRDPASGKSFRDFERDIRDLQLLHIKPLRAALTTYAFPKNGGELRAILQQHINDLEILQADAAKQAEAVGESLTRFVDAIASPARASPARRAPERQGAEQGAAGGTTIPQVGEGFIDRIIELTRASRDAERNQAFIMDQTTTQLDLNRRAIAYGIEQTRWKEMLANLPSDGTAPEPDEVARERIVQQLRFAIDEINAKWAALSGLESESGANRLSRTAEVYVPLVPGRDVIRYDPIFNRSTFVAVMSAVVLFSLGLWGLLAALFLRREAAGV